MPFALNGNVKIYYEMIGEGLPIVLQSGILGDLTIWQKAGYVSALEGYKRILIDPRGDGRSDKPETVEEHRPEKYVEDVNAVLDSIGVFRTAFMGFSQGAIVGARLASTRPGRISALVALAPSRSLPSFKEVKGAVDTIEKKEENGRVPTWFRETLLSTSPEMALLQIEGFASFRPETPRVPLLVLAGGKQDPRDVTDSFPSASAFIFEGVGEMGLFLQSERVIRAVRNFLVSVEHGMDRRLS